MKTQLEIIYNIMKNKYTTCPHCGKVYMALDDKFEDNCPDCNKEIYLTNDDLEMLAS